MGRACFQDLLLDQHFLRPYMQNCPSPAPPSTNPQSKYKQEAVCVGTCVDRLSTTGVSIYHWCIRRSPANKPSLLNALQRIDRAAASGALWHCPTDSHRHPRRGAPASTLGLRESSSEGNWHLDIGISPEFPANGKAWAEGGGRL